MDADRLAANLARVRARIAAAASRADRDPREVTLVCVTKTVAPDVVRALHRLGERDFGENRVAAGVGQAAACAFPADDAPGAARWHLIGHLQRNKAAGALAVFRRIHSVESARLVDVLARAADARGVEVDVWLEANLAGEARKYGVPGVHLAGLAAAVRAAPRLRLRGLMTMAPFTDDPETARPVFRALRGWRDRLADAFGGGLGLSMGMSGDFEVAVEEGATLVRVGSALYEEGG